VLFAIDGRPACFAISVYRQPPQRFHLTRPDKATGRRTTGSRSTHVVLRHISALLCEMFSVAPIMTDGQIEEDPLHGLHARRTWILTSVVYAAPVDNEGVLRHRIMDACQTIRNYPGISECTRRSMMRRVKACIESHGGHFEHILQMYSFRRNSQIKCFPRHVDLYFLFSLWYVELGPKVCAHLSVTPCICREIILVFLILRCTPVQQIGQVLNIAKTNKHVCCWGVYNSCTKFRYHMEKCLK
jgi:hypothetical protein